jgi:3-isopropylmalate/(R)-2-methylmalate dehydratase small subunit
MILEGKAVVIPEANVDTDVLFPGEYLNVQDPAKMKEHLFEGYDPTLREQLDGDTVLLTGENFGAGSSREHCPLAMKHSGIRCIVGKSFARIFFRNCVNLGIPILACRGAAEAGEPGMLVRVDTESGAIEVDGRQFQADPLDGFMQGLVAAGGLVPWAREQLAGGRM